MPHRSPSTPALPLPGHTEGIVLEFVIGLRGPPRDHLHLPRPFAKVTEVDKPHGVVLCVDGCRNGVMYSDVEYPGPNFMLLRRRWKTFACAHNFMAGHVLRFKLVEEDTLSIKIYGHSGARLGCCEESSSKMECSSSSDNDEEYSADGDGDIESLAVKSEYDGSGSS
ncbi:l-ascorbate oxidase-like protein [Hordeum vulgare]|nr:l-ascorbate oxidase-like protein [Hordeum vulgare]